MFANGWGLLFGGNFTTEFSTKNKGFNNYVIVIRTTAPPLKANACYGLGKIRSSVRSLRKYSSICSDVMFANYTFHIFMNFLLVMCPHSDNLYYLFLFVNLINKTMLNVYSPRISTCQIAH